MSDVNLEISYDSADLVPEAYRPLYTFEDDGSANLDLSRFNGVQTTDKVNEVLRKERELRRETEKKLASFKDVDLGEFQRIKEEYEQLKQGKTSDDDASKGYEAKLAQAQRIIEQRESEKLAIENNYASLKKELETKAMHEAVTKAATKAGVEPSAIEDAMLHAERAFEKQVDGSYATKDGYLSLSEWLDSMKPIKSHWWPRSVAGGAIGSNGKASLSTGKDNPFSKEGFNLDKQGAYIREHGLENAKKLCNAVKGEWYHD